MNKMLLAAAGAAVFAISAPAHAAQTIAVSPSTFTAGGQGGGFAGFSGGIFGYDDGVFNFTFDLTTALKTYVQMQITGDQIVPYTLFKGAVGSGVAVPGGSTNTPDSFELVLGAGSYYLQTTVAPHVGPGFDVISGAVATSAVPEPATWAMMIVGLFGVGALMRRQRRTQVLATATA